MNIKKIVSYSFGKNTMRTEYLVENGGKQYVVSEVAGCDLRDHSRPHEKVPKYFYVHEGMDSLDSWPELKSPELLSFINHVVIKGANPYHHPYTGPIGSGFDKKGKWINMWTPGALQIDLHKKD